MGSCSGNMGFTGNMGIVLNLIRGYIMSYKYIEESKAYELYDEMLDECYPEVFGILPSRILAECDPIQYNCGFSDWLDASELTIDEYEADEETEEE